MFLSARVSDGPEGKLFLEAKALFIVARKDTGAGELSSVSLQNLVTAAEAAETTVPAEP